MHQKQRNSAIAIILALQIVLTSSKIDAVISKKTSIEVSTLKVFCMRDSSSLYMIVDTRSVKPVKIHISDPTDHNQGELSLEIGPKRKDISHAVGDLSRAVLTSYDTHFQIINIKTAALLGAANGIIDFEATSISRREDLHSDNQAFSSRKNSPISFYKNPWKSDNYRLLVIDRVFSMEITNQVNMKEFKLEGDFSVCEDGYELFFADITHEEVLKTLTDRSFFAKCGNKILMRDSLTYHMVSSDILSLIFANPAITSRATLIGKNFDHLMVMNDYQGTNAIHLVKQAVDLSSDASISLTGRIR